MHALTSELSMRIVRFALLAGWCVLLFLCLVDIGQYQLTDPSDPSSIRGLTGKTIELRGNTFEAQTYNPATRFFWGIGIPLVVLILIFFGHDTWRRICPMSAISQIPRWLGFQIKTGKGKSRRVAVINPKGFLAKNAILFQFILFTFAVTLRLTVLSASPILLFIFTLIVFISAFLIGLFYSGKTWCHYFCPMNAIQLVISGPRGLNSAKPNPGGLSQSMCRKPGHGNSDISICVGCNSPCPDVDIEKNYWDRLPTIQRRLAVYGYLGVVVGFIHGLFSATGDFTYGAAIWYDVDWNAIGYSPFGQHLFIPRWLGSGLTMVFWVTISWGIGLAVEKTLTGIYRNQGNKDIAIENAQHQTTLIFSFVALVILIYGIALPGMGWLPELVVWLIGIASTTALAMWLHRSWFRTSRQYQRENLAESIRKQLGKMSQNWRDYLNGRDLSELSTDEIHLVSELTPNLESHNRAAFYEAFLNDAISQGSVDTIEGRQLLENLRVSCDISIDEHKSILEKLTGDYELNDTLLISANLRMNSFKSELEEILLNEISKGNTLHASIEKNADKIETMRQNYSLTQEEEDKAIQAISAQKSTLARLLEDLSEQFSQLANYRSVLPDANADTMLKNFLHSQSVKVLSQSIPLMETINQHDFLKEIAQRFVTADYATVTQYLENAHTAAEKTVTTANELLKQICDNTIPRTEINPNTNFEATLKVLSESSDQYISLVAARAAQLAGFGWASDVITQNLSAISDVSTKNAIEVARSSNQNHQRKYKTSLIFTPFGQNAIYAESQLSAGRSEDNDWVVTLPEASRHHFRLFIEDNRIFIEDLNSANGTLVNNKLIQSETLELTAELENDLHIRLTHDSNPASLAVRLIPTEDIHDPIDRFILLANSRKTDSLTNQARFKLALTGKPTHLSEAVEHCSEKAFFALTLEDIAPANSRARNNIARFTFIDSHLSSLILDNSPPQHIKAIVWESDILKAFFDNSEFESQVLKDMLEIYTKTTLKG